MRYECRHSDKTRRDVFGGELTMTTFGDFGMSDDPAEAAKIMHSQLDSDSVTFMAADTPAGMDLTQGTNVHLSLFGEDEAQLRGYFEKLADGGAVTMPLEKAPWGDIFGMCADRFGVQWMVNVTGGGGPPS